MENKKLDELKNVRPTKEEQLAFLENLASRSNDRLEQMKKQYPEVAEWIKNGKPGL